VALSLSFHFQKGKKRKVFTFLFLGKKVKVPPLPGVALSLSVHFQKGKKRKVPPLIVKLHQRQKLYQLVQKESEADHLKLKKL
jgi:hypothetical protein